MKFLVDANLPPALADWLREKGHECAHVRDGPGRRATDASLYEYARQHQYVLLTKDEDFAALSALQAASPSVVWIRLGNATNARLRQWLEPLLPAIVERLESGERLIEVV